MNFGAELFVVDPDSKQEVRFPGGWQCNIRTEHGLFGLHAKYAATLKCSISLALAKTNLLCSYDLSQLADLEIVVRDFGLERIRIQGRPVLGPRCCGAFDLTFEVQLHDATVAQVDVPRETARPAIACECGAAKCGTTHSTWCPMAGGRP